MRKREKVLAITSTVYEADYVSLSVVSICMSCHAYSLCTLSNFLSFFIFCESDFFPSHFLNKSSSVPLIINPPLHLNTNVCALWLHITFSSTDLPLKHFYVFFLSTAIWKLLPLCGISFFPPIVFSVSSLRPLFPFIPVLLCICSYLSLSFSHPSPILSHLPSLQ